MAVQPEARGAIPGQGEGGLSCGSICVQSATPSDPHCDLGPNYTHENSFFTAVMSMSVHRARESVTRLLCSESTINWAPREWRHLTPWRLSQISMQKAADMQAPQREQLFLKT